MWIRFSKIDGIMRIYDGTRSLELLGSQKCDAIYSRIRYLISEKKALHILCFCENQSWFLWIFTYRKKLTLHNAIIHIKTVLNKDKVHYYYKIILGKCSYQLAKKHSQISVDNIIMVTFADRAIAKEKFYTAKRLQKKWDVNVDNIIISKLVKVKTNSFRISLDI